MNSWTFGGSSSIIFIIMQSQTRVAIFLLSNSGSVNVSLQKHSFRLSTDSYIPI